MEQAELIKLIKDRYPQYIPAAFTLVLSGDDLHLFDQQEGGFEGHVETSYWSMRDEVAKLTQQAATLKADIKRLGKEKTDVEKAIKILRNKEN